MKFPVCDFAESEDGFYSQCASCPIRAGVEGCALTLMDDGNYLCEGTTPHGGMRAVFHFRDNEGNQVPKEDAEHVEIHEFDQEGHLITILYGMVDPEGVMYIKKSQKEG